MKLKVNEMLSAEGKVFFEGKEYDSKELPEQFLDGWLESGVVEKAAKAKTKSKAKDSEEAETGEDKE